jgi:hypothetical protein
MSTRQYSIVLAEQQGQRVMRRCAGVGSRALEGKEAEEKEACNSLGGGVSFGGDCHRGA